MPVDETTREYLFYLADSVRNQTTAYRYTGSLVTDAKRLGVTLHQLNETLEGKGGVTVIARELFKRMVPENQREVDHWSQLTEDVIVKEKMLLSMEYTHSFSLCKITGVFCLFRFS